MKFTPTVNLTSGADVAKLHDGEIKLQPGQWVCFHAGSRSRFLGASRHTIYALHENAASTPHIQTMRRAFKRNFR